MWQHLCNCFQVSGVFDKCSLNNILQPLIEKLSSRVDLGELFWRIILELWFESNQRILAEKSLEWFEWFVVAKDKSSFWSSWGFVRYLNKTQFLVFWFTESDEFIEILFGGFIYENLFWIVFGLWNSGSDNFKTILWNGIGLLFQLPLEALEWDLLIKETHPCLWNDWTSWVSRGEAEFCSVW